MISETLFQQMPKEIPLTKVYPAIAWDSIIHDLGVVAKELSLEIMDAVLPPCGKRDQKAWEQVEMLSRFGEAVQQDWLRCDLDLKKGLAFSVDLISYSELMDIIDASVLVPLKDADRETAKYVALALGMLPGSSVGDYLWRDKENLEEEIFELQPEDEDQDEDQGAVKQLEYLNKTLKEYEQIEPYANWMHKFYTVSSKRDWFVGRLLIEVEAWQPPEAEQPWKAWVVQVLESAQANILFQSKGREAVWQTLFEDEIENSGSVGVDWYSCFVVSWFTANTFEQRREEDANAELNNYGPIEQVGLDMVEIVKTGKFQEVMALQEDFALAIQNLSRLFYLFEQSKSQWEKGKKA